MPGPSDSPASAILPYSDERPRFPRLRRLYPYRHWLWLLLIPLFWRAAIYGRYTCSYICDDCGMLRDEVDWQLPVTDFSCWHTQADFPTPLSQAATAAGLAGPTHHWRLLHGSGNGVRCELGSASELYMAIHLPDAGRFIQAIATYRNPATARRWLTRLMTPADSEAVLWPILYAGIPNSFPTQAAFDAWWTANHSQLEPAMKQFPELDDAKATP